jgi:hypothetical protein
MDLTIVDRLLFLQDGVISRRQVLGAGGDDNDIERMLRRRVWSRIHPGVYVDHTGVPTQDQREWAAVLHYDPAALAGRSALRRYGVRTGTDRPADNGIIEIAVDHTRNVTDVPGVMVARMRHFSKRVMTNLSPPRLRLEQAVLDVVDAAPDETLAVAVIADACRSRRTNVDRLLAALDGRGRMRHRTMVHRILADASAGIHSMLEWMYLTRVERRHRLPTAKRQRIVRKGKTAAYRDVDYRELQTIVELDGRLGHELTLDRWADLERDVDAAVDGRLTVRLGWRHVVEPCRTAVAVDGILRARGWSGSAAPCSPACPITLRGGSPATSASDPPQ